MEINEIIHIYSKSLSGKVVNELFQKVTEIEFNPTIHYPLICLHIHYSMLEKAEQLMNLCTDKNDETYLCLNDFYQAILEANSCYGIFPLSISYGNWSNCSGSIHCFY